MGLIILGIKNMDNYGDGLREKMIMDPLLFLANDNNL